LSHIGKDGTIGLGGVTAFIQLLQAPFGEHERVATAERKIREIRPKSYKVSLDYAEFKVIAADLN